jgi:menaquinol-cytochrome c reductase iron-sulfur subunit
VEAGLSNPKDKDLSRRDFIKATAVFVGGSIGAVIGIPAIAYLISPSLRKNEEDAWIDLGALEGYPIGMPQLFEFTRTKVNGWERTAMGYGVFVVRPDEKSVRVFSNICTHLGCHVSWHPDVQHYISPCHDGHFDVLGGNISGPPPRPLDEFNTRIEEGNLFIQLPAFKRAS